MAPSSSLPLMYEGSICTPLHHPSSTTAAVAAAAAAAAAAIKSSSAFWAAVHSKYDAFLSHIVEGVVELKQLFSKPFCELPVLLANKRKEPARDHSGAQKKN